MTPLTSICQECDKPFLASSSAQTTCVACLLKPSKIRREMIQNLEPLAEDIMITRAADTVEPLTEPARRGRPRLRSLEAPADISPIVEPFEAVKPASKVVQDSSLAALAHGIMALSGAKEVRFVLEDLEICIKRIL